MKKHKCKICNKNLNINTYKSRLMHLRGKTHQLMKKTLLLEKLEDEIVKDEIEAIKRQINPYLLNEKNYGFRLPPINFPKNFKIPEEPKNFKLPKFFDFTNHENFKTDINETLQNMHKKFKKL